MYFPTQQAIEFWACEWEFFEHNPRAIKCWSSEDKTMPSVDIEFHETPILIQDLDGNTVWEI